MIYVSHYNVIYNVDNNDVICFRCVSYYVQIIFNRTLICKHNQMRNKSTLISMTQDMTIINLYGRLTVLQF